MPCLGVQTERAVQLTRGLEFGMQLRGRRHTCPDVVASCEGGEGNAISQPATILFFLFIRALD